MFGIGQDDIIALLSSDDWKERLRGEYYELRIRYEKLRVANVKAEIRQRLAPCCAGNAEDDTSCRLLRDQQDAMERYLHLLELRAELAGITLYTFDE